MQKEILIYMFKKIKKMYHVADEEKYQYYLIYPTLNTIIL